MKIHNRQRYCLLLDIKAKQREEDFRRNMASGFEQQERQVRDSEGNRWIKCEFCGKIVKESEFVTYGGPGRMNPGTCKECRERLQREKSTAQSPKCQASKMNPERAASNICPQCGGELVERNGRKKYPPIVGKTFKKSS